jgi:3-oxoacyl-[acyl-carrier protein] reductase
MVRDAGGTALAITADCSDPAAIKAAAARTRSELGKIAILINNAGIAPFTPFLEIDLALLEKVLRVNTIGPFLCTQECVPDMIEAKWGRIVNLSSTSALGNRGQANYAAAKAGLQGFTKTLALELGKFGVTANAIAPGFIDTEMTQATADRLGVDFEDWKAAASREIPVGRVGTPDDIAAVAAFLCSEDAGYVSGQVIYVAGGPKA